MPWIAAIVSALVIALVWMVVARARAGADARHEPVPSETLATKLRSEPLPSPLPRRRGLAPRLPTLRLYSGSVTASLGAKPVPVALAARPGAHGRPRIYFQPR